MKTATLAAFRTQCLVAVLPVLLGASVALSTERSSQTPDALRALTLSRSLGASPPTSQVSTFLGSPTFPAPQTVTMHPTAVASTSLNFEATQPQKKRTVRYVTTYYLEIQDMFFRPSTEHHTQLLEYDFTASQDERRVTLSRILDLDWQKFRTDNPTQAGTQVPTPEASYTLISGGRLGGQSGFSPRMDLHTYPLIAVRDTKSTSIHLEIMIEDPTLGEQFLKFPVSSVRPTTYYGRAALSVAFTLRHTFRQDIGAMLGEVMYPLFWIDAGGTLILDAESLDVFQEDSFRSLSGPGGTLKFYILCQRIVDGFSKLNYEKSRDASTIYAPKLKSIAYSRALRFEPWKVLGTSERWDFYLRLLSQFPYNADEPAVGGVPFGHQYHEDFTLLIDAILRDPQETSQGAMLKRTLTLLAEKYPIQLPEVLGFHSYTSPWANERKAWDEFRHKWAAALLAVVKDRDDVLSFDSLDAPFAFFVARHLNYEWCRWLLSQKRYSPSLTLDGNSLRMVGVARDDERIVELFLKGGPKR